MSIIAYGMKHVTKLYTGFFLLKISGQNTVLNKPQKSHFSNLSSAGFWEYFL